MSIISMKRFLKLNSNVNETLIIIFFSEYSRNESENYIDELK